MAISGPGRIEATHSLSGEHQGCHKGTGTGLDLTYIASKENAQQRQPTRREGLGMDRTQAGAARPGSQSRKAELDAEEVSMATLNQEGPPCSQ